MGKRQDWNAVLVDFLHKMNSRALQGVYFEHFSVIHSCLPRSQWNWTWHFWTSCEKCFTSERFLKQENLWKIGNFKQDERQAASLDIGTLFICFNLLIWEWRQIHRSLVTVGNQLADRLLQLSSFSCSSWVRCRVSRGSNGEAPNQHGYGGTKAEAMTASWQREKTL